MVSRTGMLGIAALLTLLSGIGQAEAQERQLFIYNWADYIGTTTIADFEKETGIKVTYDLFDGYEAMDARVQAGSWATTSSFPGATTSASMCCRGSTCRSTSRS